MNPSPESPPPSPDPRRVFAQRQELAPPAGEAAPAGSGPPPAGPGNRERIALIGLASLALGLGVSTAVLAAGGPEEVTVTNTKTETKTLKPTTTTVVTEVLTTNTRTTTSTTETITETVTEEAPPEKKKPKPEKADRARP